MIRLPCSKCGTVDQPKYRRMKLRSNGERTPSMATYCILCHYEAQKIREERRYDKKLEYNKEWRKNNRDLVNKWNREDYHNKTRRGWMGLQPEACSTNYR